MDETLSVIFAALHSADLPIDAMIHLAYVWVSHWSLAKLFRPEKRYVHDLRYFDKYGKF
jgi:hypothetical protein